jgi:phage terminase large subunit-like protein
VQGFDVIIDDMLHPWLLEVNMTPGIALRDVRHNAMVQNMTEGLLRLLFQSYESDSLTHQGINQGGIVIEESNGQWELLLEEAKEDVKSRLANDAPDDRYLDNRVAVIGKNIPQGYISLLDGCFERCEKQLLLQRCVLF